WMTDKQFADAFSLSQAAPGPKVLYVTLIGWQIAGLVGAVATTLAVAIPSTAITLAVVRLSARNPDAPLRRAIRAGLAPIAIGLSLSSGWILVRSVAHDWRGALLTVLALVLILRTRANPLWLLAAGAAAGIAGVV
ncbi:MAG: chromate transporter, partial [Betaproteobacteria bacterium]|nr:chromate transporter [Betaproteobacteria bacterium]